MESLYEMYPEKLKNWVYERIVLGCKQEKEEEEEEALNRQWVFCSSSSSSSSSFSVSTSLVHACLVFPRSPHSFPIHFVFFPFLSFSHYRL